MEEYSDFLPFDDGNINHLITKFKQMQAIGTTCYFDVAEFEELIDFYIGDCNQKLIQMLLRMGKNQHPDSISIQLKEAESLIYDERSTEALKIVENVSLYGDSNPEHYFSKASIYSMADQKEKAIETLNRLIEISDNEDKVDAKMALAKELQEIGDYSASIIEYKDILKLSPSNEDALMEISLSCELSGRYQEGVDLINEFIDQTPYSCYAWFSLGNMHMTSKAYDQAVTAYEYATLINTHFYEAFFNLGNALMKNECFEDAIVAYNSSITDNYTDPITYNFIGHCYIVLEKNEDAITYFQKAIDYNPEYADGWLGFAVAYANMDLSKEGLMYIEKALRINPENIYYHYFHADLLINVGDFDQAESVYDKVYQSEIESPGIFIDYAKALYTNKKIDKALDILIEGISQYPEEAELYYKYAAILIEVGKLSDAESILFLALEMDPDKRQEFISYCPEANKHNAIINLLENYN